MSRHLKLLVILFARRFKLTIVLVIGAGLVGVTLAIMLASQGYTKSIQCSNVFRVEVIVCESNDERKTSRVIPLLLLSRTIEVYRSLGLADEIIMESER
jgi:2-polyprenyl-6-methoxyphenol hydroxylase-like FAD-dependent oxidoreductase